MPWSHPSSTPVVSRSPTGCLAPGAPLALRCQGPQRQSPEPSAARVTRTRTKSASTTATWISSGSTPPSKICLVGWLLNVEALPVVLHVSRLARQVNFIFCNQGGDEEEQAITFWQTSGRFVQPFLFFFGKRELSGEASHALKLQTAVTFQVMASPAESNGVKVMPGHSLTWRWLSWVVVMFFFPPFIEPLNKHSV